MAVKENNQKKANTKSKKLQTETLKAAAPSTPAESKVTYSMSGGFAEFLSGLKIGLALTSYQSSKLYLLSKNTKGGLMVNEQIYPRAMGLTISNDQLLLSTHGQIVEMVNVLEPGQWINETFTECYVPRTSHFIGELDCHDVGILKSGEIVFVNTKYNCLATISTTQSFREFWRPKFITKLVQEDRCHLNGMAMQDGEVKYVTAVCRSDTIDGWRDRRSGGGIIIDVKKNEIICEGLSMPHSPRLYDGKLWVLNSGTGDFGYVDEKNKKFESVAFCPGFLRGLSFHGDFAFVGLSRPRYSRFEGLDLDQKLKDADSEPWTGVQVINIKTGACVHWFRMDGPVSELYDVLAIPGIGCAKSVGLATAEAQTLITIES